MVRDFPGCPVAKTLCQGSGFNPWARKRSHMPQWRGHMPQQKILCVTTKNWHSQINLKKSIRWLLRRLKAGKGSCTKGVPKAWFLQGYRDGSLETVPGGGKCLCQGWINGCEVGLVPVRAFVIRLTWDQSVAEAWKTAGLREAGRWLRWRQTGSILVRWCGPSERRPWSSAGAQPLPTP